MPDSVSAAYLELRSGIDLAVLRPSRGSLLTTSKSTVSPFSMDGLQVTEYYSARSPESNYKWLKRRGGPLSSAGAGKRICLAPTHDF